MLPPSSTALYSLPTSPPHQILETPLYNTFYFECILANIYIYIKKFKKVVIIVEYKISIYVCQYV